MTAGNARAPQPGAPGAVPLPTIERAAADVFGLRPGASADETRSAILARLGDGQFLLDPVAHEAALVLSGRGRGEAPLLAEVGTAFGWQLGQAIEAFAARFFDRPAAERRGEWQALRQASTGSPALLARLRGLEGGLAVEPARIEATTPAQSRLVMDVLELFVLAPGPRAVALRERTWERLQDDEIPRRDRLRARKDLRRRLPAVAALGEDYLDRLDPPRAALRWRRKWAGALKPAALVGAGGPGWRYLLVLVVVSNLLRVAFSPGRSPARPSAPLAGPIARPIPAPGPVPIPGPPGSIPLRARVPLIWPMPEVAARTPSAPERAVRQRLDAPLRAELGRRGIILGDRWQLPVGLKLLGPMQSDGPTAAMATGAWSDADKAALAGALLQNLERAGFNLTPDQVAEVVRATVEAAARPVPQEEP